MQKPIRTMISSAVVAILASNMTNAAGFSLYTESSPAAMGNNAAGIAAEAADASTGWYNPAGLAVLDKQQLVVGGTGIAPNSKLTGTSTFATTTPPLPSYIQNFSGLQGGINAFVPALHYAQPIGERAGFGLSIVSPFGLSTDYDPTSPVRYAATFSEVLTANISPELGGKLTDNLAIGAGIDLQWARVKLNRILGAPTLLQAGGLAPSLFDSLSYNKGHSFGVGFHAGVLTMFNDNHTRVGLNYQSKMRHKFHGFSELTGRLADDTFADRAAAFRSENLFSNDIELPDVITLSAYQDINQRWALLGSVVYTGWSVLKTIELNNVAAFSSTAGQVIVNSVSAQNFRNTWRASLGANYHINDQWMMRVGAGYDQTPTIDSEREVRLPDANRWALSIGAHYQMRPSVGFDLGYTYVVAANEAIVNRHDALGTTSSYTVSARAKPTANLVGLQAVWTMDQPAVVPTK